MKLQILVPQYNETDEIVKPLLDSIAIQQCVDFGEIGVIITNDGSNIFLSEALLKSYPFDIKYIKAKHGGISATRNTCLDLATADYICFCDADDLFLNNAALFMIFQNIDNGGFDSLVSVFMEDVHANGKTVFIPHEKDEIFVHGKFYRRMFLIENKIRWDNSLNNHEDGYFNRLALNCSENRLYLPQAIYLWKHRENSVCRVENFVMKTYADLFRANIALVNQYIRRAMWLNASFSVCEFMFEAFYTQASEEWQLPENAEYLALGEKLAADYYRNYKEIFDAADQRIKDKLIKLNEEAAIAKGTPYPDAAASFGAWLERIEAII